MELNFRIAELIALQERSELERQDVRWRAEAADLPHKRSVVRGAAASALVRLGMLLDRSAIERAAPVARGLSR